MLEAGRNHYILVLIRALERRALDGELDEALADHIERLLRVGKPDPAGEAEYASWVPVSGVLAVDPVHAERERCAAICDAEAKRLKAQREADVWCGHADTGAMVCANLIRTGNAYGVLVLGEPSDKELLEAARDETALYEDGVNMLDGDTLLRVLRAVARKFPAGVAIPGELSTKPVTGD
jgi:hypothetical protein